MKAVWVREIPGFRITGKQDENKDYVGECTCGHAYWCGDYWALRSWISSHAARHMLKAVSR